MISVSILFQNAADRIPEQLAVTPPCFSDLNLDQIVTAITADKREYNLTPFFHTPLHAADAVLYRHEVTRDLEDASVAGAVKAFASNMRAVREHLAQLDNRFYERQKDRWFLDAVDIYCDAVIHLASDLPAATFRSRGLQAFCEYLTSYAASEVFLSLASEAKQLKSGLSAIRYNVYIRGTHVEVRPHAGESDYSAEVEETFARFQQRGVGAFNFKFDEALEMNHIEAQILDGVAYFLPGTFSKLANYRVANADFWDATLVAFDREIQFYIAYLDYIASVRAVGLKFCYPLVSDSRKEFQDLGGFDLALAKKLIGEHVVPITNDFTLKGQERILVVSGPNQGGKTTTARTFGQLHYLGSIGLPVPGSTSRINFSLISKRKSMSRTFVASFRTT